MDQKNKKVLVLGEWALDSYHEGTVSRLSPEGPIPVFVPNNKFSVSGMTGNVVNNLKSLNSELDVFYCCQKTPIIKTRYVDKNSGYILLRVDENDQIKKEEELTELKILNYLNDNKVDFPDFAAIVISSYKNFISPNLINYLGQIGRIHKIPTFLDCKYILGEWSKDITFVKINQKEYNYNLERNSNLGYFCRNLIVTLGENGSKHIQTNNIVHTASCSSVDVCGAGDVYLAAFVVKYLETFNIPDSMLYANYAAS